MYWSTPTPTHPPTHTIHPQTPNTQVGALSRDVKQRKKAAAAAAATAKELQAEAIPGHQAVRNRHSHTGFCAFVVVVVGDFQAVKKSHTFFLCSCGGGGGGVYCFRRKIDCTHPPHNPPQQPLTPHSPPPPYPQAISDLQSQVSGLQSELGTPLVQALTAAEARDLKEVGGWVDVAVVVVVVVVVVAVVLV